jgi:hypothetical protein
MTRLWPHPPGTLRALKATFKSQYVICRPCRRYTPMRVADKDLDRKYEPCPFRCDICKQRGAIVFDVPKGFNPVGQELGPPAHRPSF